MDAAAEDWLWSLPWAPALEPESDWSAVIQCLRKHDCADWADLIEALTQRRPSVALANQPDKINSAMNAECH